ncbi:hypothetical protein GUJ93_ZPchr0006g44506 [Zizania palustris]|uniref:P-type ATPase A domain-containing protein n=1 Tax=Zizania palustris TaxID=103762 RepID=A0A8J5VJ68_ZIZPA|nr:hypothetical protein GUJ93_ZPchr0006g44506 [Zizania palustris]
MMTRTPCSVVVARSTIRTPSSPAVVVALDEVGGPAKWLRRARSTLGLPAAPTQDAGKAHCASLRPYLRSTTLTRARLPHTPSTNANATRRARPPRASGASASDGRCTRLRRFFPTPSRPGRRFLAQGGAAYRRDQHAVFFLDSGGMAVDGGEKPRATVAVDGGEKPRATASDPIPCVRRGGPFGKTGARRRTRWERLLGGPAVAGRPVRVLVHLSWVRCVAHAQGVRATTGRLVHVLVHKPHLYNPLLPWARHVAHASAAFFILQPCAVDVGWEVWAGCEGLPVVDGSGVVILWVVHKAGSLVFCSITWDQVLSTIMLLAIASAVQRSFMMSTTIYLLATGLIAFLTVKLVVEYAKAPLEAKANAPRAKVLRDGKWIDVHAENLVPGDIISLKVGDIVPANARILRFEKIDTITCWANRYVDCVHGFLIYYAWTVSCGQGTAVVIATGRAIPRSTLSEAILCNGHLMPLIGVVPMAMPVVLYLALSFGYLRLCFLGIASRGTVALEDLATSRASRSQHELYIEPIDAAILSLLDDPEQ